MERSQSDAQMDALTEGLSDWSGDEDTAWYFDLPDGAWARQEQKNRELRENVRQNIRTQNETETTLAKKDPFRGKPGGGEAAGDWTLTPGSGAAPESGPGGPDEAPAPAPSWSPPPLRPRSRAKDEGAAEGFGWARTGGGFDRAAAADETMASDTTEDDGEVFQAMKAWSSQGQSRRRIILGGGPARPPADETAAPTERWDFSNRKGQGDRPRAPERDAVPPPAGVPAIRNTWMVEDELENPGVDLQAVLDAGPARESRPDIVEMPDSELMTLPEPAVASPDEEPGASVASPAEWTPEPEAEIEVAADASLFMEPEPEPIAPVLAIPEGPEAEDAVAPQVAIVAELAELETASFGHERDEDDEPILDQAKILAMPLRPIRASDTEESAPDPNRAPTKWDDMFAQPVGDSIVDAMRHWQEQVKEEEARARDVSLLPPELLQPFDWEQEPDGRSDAPAPAAEVALEPPPAPIAWDLGPEPALSELLRTSALHAALDAPAPAPVVTSPPTAWELGGAPLAGWAAPEEAAHPPSRVEAPPAAPWDTSPPIPEAEAPKAEPPLLTSPWDMDLDEAPFAIRASPDEGAHASGKAKSGLLSKLFARGPKTGEWVAPSEEDWKAPRAATADPLGWPAPEGAPAAPRRGPNAAASAWGLADGNDPGDVLNEEPIGSWHGLRNRAAPAPMDPALVPPPPQDNDPVASFDDETGRLVYDLPRRFEASPGWDDSWLEGEPGPTGEQEVDEPALVTKLETLIQDSAQSSGARADIVAAIPHPEVEATSHDQATPTETEPPMATDAPFEPFEPETVTDTEPATAPTAIRPDIADPWASFLKTHQPESGDAFAFISDRESRRAS